MTFALPHGRCNRCYREGRGGFVVQHGRVICASPRACDKRRLEMADKTPAALISGRRLLQIRDSDEAFLVDLEEDLTVVVQRATSDWAVEVRVAE